MKLILRSMQDGHPMGEVKARTDAEARRLAAEQIRPGDDVAGLYGPRGGFHGVVTLPRVRSIPRVGTQRQRRAK